MILIIISLIIQSYINHLSLIIQSYGSNHLISHHLIGIYRIILINNIGGAETFRVSNTVLSNTYECGPGS